MSGVKAKMHQIQFLLVLRPRPCWGAYSAPSYSLADLRGLLLMAREGKEGVEGEKGPFYYFLQI